MQIRNMQDFLGGVLVIATGLAIALYALASYDLGTLRRMGPGMFPFGVGGVMAMLGVVILIPAFLRPGELPEVRLRPAIAILASVAAFALTIQSFGLIVAIVLLVAISSVADETPRPRTMLILAAVLCTFAYLVFRVGLGLAIPMMRWPF